MKVLRRITSRDEGLGLVEIMISIVILGFVMVAMLSLLVSAINTVAKNSTRATATELATQRLEDARVVALTGACNNVMATIAVSETIPDGRGVPLTVTATVDNCPAGNTREQPQLARVTVTVTTTQPGFTNPVATVASDVYVRFEAS